MEELNIIYKNIYDNIDIITDTIVSFYGEEYRKKIETNLRRTYFLFDSLPKDNYEYEVNSFNYLIDKEKRREIIKEYNDYVSREKTIDKYVNKEKEKFIIDYFKLYNNKIAKKNIEKLTMLIEEYLSISYNFKNYIQYYKTFKKYYFDINLITNSFRDKYKKKLDELNDHKALWLIEKTKYWNRMKNEINDKDIEYLKFLFNNNKQGHTHKYFNKDEKCFYHYIRLPIIQMINENQTNIIDMSIIHEMIHVIESDEESYCSGILEISSDLFIICNWMANELKTQIITNEIIKKLHNNGVYLYKNINNGKGVCDYEKLFIFCKLFYEYMDIFKYCSINNKPDYLPKCFGKNWKVFSKELDNIYKIVKHKKMDEYLYKQVNKMNRLYNNMDRYYKKHGTCEIMNNNGLVKRKE